MACPRPNGDALPLRRCKLELGAAFMLGLVQLDEGWLGSGERAGETEREGERHTPRVWRFPPMMLPACARSPSRSDGEWTCTLRRSCSRSLSTIVITFPSPCAAVAVAALLPRSLAPGPPLVAGRV